MSVTDLRDHREESEPVLILEAIAQEIREGTIPMPTDLVVVYKGDYGDIPVTRVAHYADSYVGVAMLEYAKAYLMNLSQGDD